MAKSDVAKGALYFVLTVILFAVLIYGAGCIVWSLMVPDRGVMDGGKDAHLSGL